MTSIWQERMSKIKAKINIDQLATLLDLPTWERIDELNVDFYGEGLDFSEDNEEESLQAESERQNEVFKSWHDAIMAVAEKLFENHGLELDPVKFKRKVPDGTRPYEFIIKPMVSWDDAALRTIATINGYGMFHFNSLKDFKDSGPYTARQGVLSHMQWMRYYPAIYGERSLRQQYDNAF